MTNSQASTGGLQVNSRSMLAGGALIAVGGDEAGIMSDAASAAGLKNVFRVPDAEAAAQTLSELARAGDLVLVKGSRASKMERVIEAFQSEKFNESNESKEPKESKAP